MFFKVESIGHRHGRSSSRSRLWLKYKKGRVKDKNNPSRSRERKRRWQTWSLQTWNTFIQTRYGQRGGMARVTASTQSTDMSTAFSGTRDQQPHRGKPLRSRRLTSLFQFQERVVSESKQLRFFGIIRAAFFTSGINAEQATHVFSSIPER